jgi:RNA polymerase sigma factor (sigma-70 family)
MVAAAAAEVETAEAATDVIRPAPAADRTEVSPLLLRRLSDESLGRRLAVGEAAAFDELYRRYVNRLAAYGAHLLGDAAAGDDVAQSTLFKVYGTLRDGRVPDHVKPWLYRVAHNTAVDLLARRRELPVDGLPERAAPAGETTTGALVAALASLPERQRHVYIMREVHGLRIDETAVELGLTGAQVEQALFAARNRLAEHLVFGDRLNCVAVQRLASGPLDRDERRALRTHLRSCPDCRRAVGSGGRPLGLVPVDALAWLRALPGLLAGGGAPAAVKVGAVVATATLAGGAPIAYVIHQEHNPRRVAAPAPVHVHTRPPVRHVTAVRRVATPPPKPVAELVRAPVPVERRDPSGLHERGGTTDTPVASHEADGARGGDVTSDRERGDRHDGDSSARTPAPVPVSTSAESRDAGAGPAPAATTTVPETLTAQSSGDDGSAGGPDTSGGSGRDGGSGSSGDD